MQTNQVINYLKKHRQGLDRDIAHDTGMTLFQIQKSIAELIENKLVSSCAVISFVDGVPVKGIFCRILGHVPHFAPCRKSNAVKNKI
jgi:hypothetical protein